MIALERLNNKKIILASKSPRRQFLLKEIGLNFEVLSAEVDEIYPETLSPEEIVIYLSDLKAEALKNKIIDDNTIIISADTIVCIDEHILGKPLDFDDAVKMLKILSGHKHEVITGVSIHSKSKSVKFYSKSDVFFKKLDIEEIEFYVKKFKPYDKAGSYGIQEWIGYIAIERVEGSFYNVMGLPIARLYEELKKF